MRAVGKQLEAAGTRWALDNLHFKGAAFTQDTRPVGPIGAVGPQFAQPGETDQHNRQQPTRHDVVSIIGLGHEGFEDQTERIDD